MKNKRIDKLIDFFHDYYFLLIDFPAFLVSITEISFMVVGSTFAQNKCIDTIIHNLQKN